TDDSHYQTTKRSSNVIPTIMRPQHELVRDQLKKAVTLLERAADESEDEVSAHNGLLDAAVRAVRSVRALLPVMVGCAQAARCRIDVSGDVKIEAHLKAVEQELTSRRSGA